MAARFFTLRDRVYRTFLPLTCFSGQSPNQELKAEALRKRERSGPTSMMMVLAVMALIPGTSVKSTPAMRNSSAFKSNAGYWLLMIGYFIPGVRHITALGAGISRISFRPFMVFAYTGAVI